MARVLGTLFGALLVLLGGASLPLLAQVGAPLVFCEAIKGYPQAMCLGVPDGDPQGSLRNRTPLVMIHGWNPKEVAALPDSPLWPGLGPYLYDNPKIQERFKMYFVVYRSNIQGYTLRDMGLTFRSLVAKMDQADSDFRSKPLVILGHSLGNLLARSFMKENQPGSSRFGGDRVARLITLGAPHHGSPFANGPARDVKAGLEAFLLHQLVDGGLFGYDIRWDMDNRYDIHWDNYDSLLDYRSFPESSLWLEWLNSGDIFAGKLIAYGGRVSITGQAADCLLGQASSCLGAIMNRALGIAESDGIVPLKSALFDPCIGCLATRVFDGYDHSEMVRGKFRFFGEREPLFEAIERDLLNVGDSRPARFD